MAQVTEDVLRQQLADCHRMMVMAELLDYSGHVSARIPGSSRVLILPRDASRASVTAEEILVVDLDGKLLDGKGPAPTETAIHLGVYRVREDVSAIGHGHPPMSTLFTMVNRPMIAMRNFGFRFIGTPVHPDPTHIGRWSRVRRSPKRWATASTACCADMAASSRWTAFPRSFSTAWRWRRTPGAPSRLRRWATCGRSRRRRSNCSSP